jgi:hypothetical protein
MSTPAPPRDPGPLIALGVVLLGITLAVAGATLLWGAGGGLLVGGLLAVVVGLALGWE